MKIINDIINTTNRSGRSVMLFYYGYVKQCRYIEKFVFKATKNQHFTAFVGRRPSLFKEQSNASPN